MPYYNSGVQVERNAVYFKLQSKIGIVVMWNGDDAVMVTESLFRISVSKTMNETRNKNSSFLSFFLRVVG